MAVVHIINKQSSTDDSIMRLVRRFVLATLSQLTAYHPFNCRLHFSPSHTSAECRHPCNVHRISWRSDRCDFHTSSCYYACSTKLVYHRTWKMLLQRFSEVPSLPRYLLPQIYNATLLRTYFEMETHQIVFLIISMQPVTFILFKVHQIQQIHFWFKRFYKVVNTRLLTRTLVF